jgi:hypothetical protein
MGTRGRIKGAPLADLLRAYREHARPEDWRRVTEALRALPPGPRLQVAEDRDTLGILKGSWYPSETMHAAADAMVVGLTPAQLDQLAERLAQGITELTLRGLYRVFFKLLATPQRYCENVARLWGQSHDSGVVTARLVDANTVDTRAENWLGHHPFACHINGRIAAQIFRAMGCKQVRFERTCLSETAGFCGQTLHWIEQ